MVVLAAITALACGPFDGGADSLAADGPIIDAPRRTSHSVGGERVTLELPTGTLHSGPVELALEVVAESPMRPHSVDLVSPSMPMHGVVRTPVTATGPGRYSARVEIPMEGRWSIYVNLDSIGADAVEFQLVVEPPLPHGAQRQGP